MSLDRFYRVSGFFLIIAIVMAGGGAACRSQTGGSSSGTPEGLVVINAPVTGKVRRILVSEGTSVREKASLMEITVVADVPPVSSDNENRQANGSGVSNRLAEIRAAEEDLQRAAVELQRIEPLVASGNAPQAHLDAARAQYQQAQERVDQLRRQSQNAPPSDLTAREKQSSSAAAPGGIVKENIVAVPAPVAGNVRVIGVRVGQVVSSGDPVATISTTR